MRVSGARPRHRRARPRDVLAIARGTKHPRDARTYRRLASTAVGELGDVDAVRRGLRVFSAREKLRIAARELTPNIGGDVDVTARELSDLADVCIDVALTEARTWGEQRFGVPTTSAGERCAFVVVGMGKLGGRELNAGSDVDLLLFYETDDGTVAKDGQTTEQSLHEHFARVAQRLVATLDEATEDGVVWRVDLRLRPEGSKGALVNALAAAERYYETWGRTWERSALVRARPVAGDHLFGQRVLDALTPFVWRRTVDPTIADALAQLLARARAEHGQGVESDIKIGPGGIREVEFFAQALELVWGGRDASLRRTNTLEALRALRSRGFVTDREGARWPTRTSSCDACEHRIQNATGHPSARSIPSDPVVLGVVATLARFSWHRRASRGSSNKTRGQTVSARFGSILSTSVSAAQPDAPYQRLWLALDARDVEGVRSWWTERDLPATSPDLARHLVALARRPDAPLGASTRDNLPEASALLVAAIADAPDPDLAARGMAALFGRLMTPSVYVRALADDPRAMRRLVGVFGASAFLGASIIAHPELLDRLLFGRGAPSRESARATVDEEVLALDAAAAKDAHAFVAALRRAKQRVTVEVGLADLAGELGEREVAAALSELADATLEHACRFALMERGLDGDRGLAILAMGKLGGREIGYGSDLDLFFVHDAAPDDDDASERFIRAAQRVLRLVGMPHDDGPGYELDTRLRPSGSQGLLVVSREAFSRYQEERAEPWERQALIKARACAGRPHELGRQIVEIASTAAYERGAAAAEDVHRLRLRMEKEIGRERLDKPPARYDLKSGRGGIVDVEFAVQWLQMRHGTDTRVRSAGTEIALGALEACGYLDVVGGVALERLSVLAPPGATPPRLARRERAAARRGGSRVGSPRAPHGDARRAARLRDDGAPRALRRDDARRALLVSRRARPRSAHVGTTTARLTLLQAELHGPRHADRGARDRRRRDTARTATERRRRAPLRRDRSRGDA